MKASLWEEACRLQRAFDNNSMPAHGAPAPEPSKSTATGSGHSGPDDKAKDKYRKSSVAPIVGGRFVDLQRDAAVAFLEADIDGNKQVTAVMTLSSHHQPYHALSTLCRVLCASMCESRFCFS